MIEDIDYCATCEHCDCEPHFEPCVSCKTKYIGAPTKYSAKKRTNADRIRAMSDEALAKHFSGLICDINEGVEYHEAPSRWLEWLKQPAEV